MLKNLKIAICLVATLCCVPLEARAASPVVTTAHQYFGTLSTSGSMSFTTLNPQDQVLIVIDSLEPSSQSLTSVSVDERELTGIPSNYTVLNFSDSYISSEGSYQGAGIYISETLISGVHTIAWSASGNVKVAMMVAELHGVWVPDVGASSIMGGSSSTPASNPITPTGDNELLIGTIGLGTAAQTLSAWNGGFTQADSVGTALNGFWAYLEQSTAAPVDASGTLGGSDYWIATIAALKHPSRQGLLCEGDWCPLR